MHRGKLLGIGLLTVLSLFVSSQLFAQQDVVKKRKNFMDDNYDALKAIKRAVPEKDYATIQIKAKHIMDNMDKLVDYFPKGSMDDSRALPVIWEKWDEFSKLPLKVKDVSGALAKAAADKDDKKLQAEFKALGPDGPFRSGACYQCHKQFRDNTKKKN